MVAFGDLVGLWALSRHVCIYVCVCVCLYIYMCVYIYIYMSYCVCFWEFGMTVSLVATCLCAYVCMRELSCTHVALARHACMYACVYVCELFGTFVGITDGTHINAYVYMHKCMCVFTYYIYIWFSTYIYICMYACVCVCTYHMVFYIYTCMYVCM